MSNLINAVIAGELDDVETAVLNIWAHASDVSTIESTAKTNTDLVHLPKTTLEHCPDAMGLDIISRTLAEQPDAIDSLSTACQLSSSYNMLSTVESVASIHLRQTRASIMKANCSLFAWIDLWLPAQCDRLGELDRKDLNVNLHWLYDLCVHIKSAVACRHLKDKEFKSDQYTTRLPASVTTIRDRCLPFNMQPSVHQTLIVEIVQEVVSGWLGIVDENLRWKAWFVAALLENFNENVLLLEYVWTAHQKMKKSTLLRQHSNTPKWQFMEPFKESLRGHPLSHSSSAESNMITRLSDFMQAKSEHDAQAVSGRRSLLGMQVPKVIMDAREKRLKAFGDFVVQSLGVFYHTVDKNTANSLQLAILESPNTLSPFREHSPDRLRFQGSDSPFSPEHIHEPYGLFSALIWRIITFNTPFSAHEPMIYHDIDEWNKAIEEIHDSTYVCDPMVYGHPGHRGPLLAKLLWPAALNSGWQDICRDIPHDFQDLVNFFLAPKRFPQLGILIGFLLCSDYVYSGVAKVPTIEVVGECISRINSGGARGLELMGLLEEHNPKGRKHQRHDDGACIHAAQTAYHFIGNLLTSQEQKDVTYDSIMTENALCKFKRLVSRKLIHF